VLVAHDRQEAVSLARGTHAFVAGGADVYELFLPMATKLFITRVHAAFEGDTCFPAFDAREWELVGPNVTRRKPAGHPLAGHELPFRASNAGKHVSPSKAAWTRVMKSFVAWQEELVDVGTARDEGMGSSAKETASCRSCATSTPAAAKVGPAGGTMVVRPGTDGRWTRTSSGPSRACSRASGLEPGEIFGNAPRQGVFFSMTLLSETRQ